MKYLTSILLIILVHSSKSQVNKQDSLALVAIYQNMGGDNWKRNDNWLVGNVDIWYGVTVVDSRISALELSSNSLTGRIPTEISNLTALLDLDFAGNALWTSIPAEIGALTNLRYLNLVGCVLTGNIPSSLGNLSDLEVLNLRQNLLEGGVPDEIFDLTNLKYLYLDGNELVGEISVEITNLSSIQTIDLRDNYLCEPSSLDFKNFINNIGYGGTGIKCDSLIVPPEDSLALVALYQSTNGENWDINHNWLEERVGSWFGIEVSSNRVKEISLPSNGLIGTLPIELDKLSGLEYMDLSRNEISGGVPTWFGQLDELQALVLDENNFSSTIPDELADLQNLVYLSINNNDLSASIPAGFWSNTKLESLSLRNNDLSGDLTNLVSSATSLRILDLSGNSLLGEIPVEYFNHPTLEYLGLRNNTLEGEIPDGIETNVSLTSVDLSYNLLVGSIPLSFVNLSQLGIDGVFDYSNTQICEPYALVFQEWKNGRSVFGTNVSCVSTSLSSFKMVGYSEVPSINRSDYTITFNTIDESSLVAEFEVAFGASVYINEVLQESAVTSNDFSSPVTYSIVSQDKSDTSEWLVVISSLSETITSIDDSFFNGLKIYPNPVRDFLYIEDSEKRIQNIQLINLTGQLIRTYHMANPDNQYDLSGMKRGVYLLQIELDNKRLYNTRILIQD